MKSAFQLDPLNIEKEEDLLTERKKEIIQRIINELFLEDSTLYYAVTSDVSKLVEQRIQNKVNLNHFELELVKDLTSKDISILISYHTNCC